MATLDPGRVTLHGRIKKAEAVLALLGVVLALGGILISCYAIKDAKRIITEAQAAIHQDVAHLDNELSTRSIGTFPGNMEKILDVLSRAEKTITIAMDVPAYGRYSNLETFKAIRDVIQRKHDADKVTISIMVLTGARRTRQMQSQFASLDFKKEIEGSGKLVPFLEDFGYGAPVKSTADFLAAVEACHVQTAQHLQLYTTFAELNDDMPIFMWIADKQEAVFSISSFDSGKVFENSFYTRDQKVVEGLASVFASYQRTANPLLLP